MSHLELDGIEKRFGATVALRGVTLSAAAGEVHAVVGENGAGKSTLMAILSGALGADRGHMRLGGAAFAPRTPMDARAAGVTIVHQELSLCPHLTVAENILLGQEPTRHGLLDHRAAAERAASALERLGVELPLDVRVESLSPASRQLVEIARAIAGPAEGVARRVLILDEPTSSLGSDDVARLFALVRRLREQGATILYISHFLEEVFELADGYSVLRDGAVVDTGRLAETTMEALVERMVGRPIERLFVRSERRPGEVVCEVEGLFGEDKPRGASFTLRRGEVLGIAGLVGSGRTELLRALFGLDAVKRGTLRIGTTLGPRAPTRRLADGVGYLSEDRKGEGLLLPMSVADNLTLTQLPRRAGVVNDRAQLSLARGLVERLAIRCSDPRAPVTSLSGGNQQKVALGRLLHHDVDVLLLDEPTRGIDVGSKAEIYALIDELAKSGKSVLLVSSQFPEILGICDRVMVMRRGHLGPARDAREATPEALLAEATGAA